MMSSEFRFDVVETRERDTDAESTWPPMRARCLRIFVHSHIA